MSAGLRVRLNGRAIKKARLAALKSQDELAREAGVHKWTLLQWENRDGREAYLSTVQRVAHALDVDPKTLIRKPR